MLKQTIDMGVISLFFTYSLDGDVAVIHRLEIGGANAVDFPLTDKWDADNFSKMLSGRIGLDVVVPDSEVVS